MKRSYASFRTYAGWSLFSRHSSSTAFTSCSGGASASQHARSHVAVAPNEQRLVPLVAFPGLNAPPPDGAEPRAWDWRGPVTRVADGSALDSRAEPSRR